MKRKNQSLKQRLFVIFSASYRFYPRTGQMLKQLIDTCAEIAGSNTSKLKL
jgi:hypothetical protein